MYKVYVKTDNIGRVISVNSDAFLPDTTGWEQIDEGDGDKFMHAQGNYLPKSIMTEQGVYRYKLVDGKVIERTAEEIAADIAAIPPPPPTVDEKLTALRPLMTELVRDKPPDVVIKSAGFVLDWTQGAYIIGDVRMWDGQPRRCCQAHTSVGNPTWTPAVASLWSPYHGTTKATALPWIKPSGAQDMYKKGECMVWTDGKTYRAKADMVYTPVEHAQEWEAIE